MALNGRSARWMMVGLLPMLLGAREVGTRGPALDLQPESRLWVSGTSSVRAWECKATTFAVTVESDTNAAAATLAGEKAVNAADVVVSTERLECGNGSMNGHMRKALKMQEHALIAFRMASYELTKSNDSLLVTVKGALTLGGTEKPIELLGLATTAPDGALRVTGTYPLKMTEFGLNPPTLMFGRIKVHDLVKVGFDVVLKDRAD